MKYKNVKTGEIRDFSCTIKSEFWEAQKKEPPVSFDEESEKPTRKKRG